MLFPKKVKHRKWQTGRTNLGLKGRTATRGTTVAFGSHGLRAQTHGRIKSNQIESCRKVITRSLKKTGRMWIRVFPDRPFTSKPAEVKMGKGKGELQGYEVEILPGRILFEVDGLTAKEAQDALVEAGSKLPIKTKVVAR